MAGAALNFADHNGNSSSGFSGSLDLSDRVQARHDIVRNVWDLFESLPWHATRPAPDLVDAGYCLAAPGVAYIVYLERGGRVNIRVDGGPYAAEWISARDASDRRPNAAPDADGAFTAPDSEDWILYLEAQ